MNAVLAVIIGVALVAILVAIEAWLVMVLWGVVASAFGWPTIGFWVTFALIWLVHILLGKFKVEFR